LNWFNYQKAAASVTQKLPLFDELCQQILDRVAKMFRRQSGLVKRHDHMNDFFGIRGDVENLNSLCSRLINNTVCVVKADVGMVYPIFRYKITVGIRFQNKILLLNVYSITRKKIDRYTRKIKFFVAKYAQTVDERSLA